MSKKRIYIAGPMRGHKLYNWPAFEAAADELRNQMWEPVSPAALETRYDPYELPNNHDWSELPPGISLDDTITRDVSLVLKCDAIALLSGWASSIGAISEAHVASWAKKPLYQFLDGELRPYSSSSFV